MRVQREFALPPLSLQGFAFGTGSAIAHRAVGAVANSFGGSATEAAPAAAAAAGTVAAAAPMAAPTRSDCALYQRDFIQCVKENKNDIAACQMYLDTFNNCTAETH